MKGIAPLFTACEHGHTEVVKKLLAANADVERKTLNPVKALHAACENGHADVVATLLAANAKVNHPNKSKSPLYLACENGHLAVVKQLLAANAKLDQRVNNDDLEIEGDTPLLIACQNGHAEVAALLLEAGADVNKGDDHGFPAMYTAQCDAGHLDRIQLLCSYGASRAWTTKWEGDMTAEGQAKRGGYDNVLEWLVATRHCSTALHHLGSSRPSARSRCARRRRHPRRRGARRADAALAARAGRRRRAARRRARRLPRPRGGEAVEPRHAQVLPEKARAAPSS